MVPTASHHKQTIHVKLGTPCKPKRNSLSCVATDISIEKPKKVGAWGMERPFMFAAPLGRLIVNWFAGGGLGIAGGTR